MDFKTAQKDMRDAYLNGGSGVLISGLVWMGAGVSAMYTSKMTAFVIFFIGGMLIHPLGVMLDKVLGRRGAHAKGNPLGHLALESTAILFVGLFIVYALFRMLPEWLFPIMLLTIGVRYLIFQTVYGLKVYWVLGGLLIGAGVAGLMMDAPFYTFGIVGGAIELIFAMVIIQMARKTMP